MCWRNSIGGALSFLFSCPSPLLRTDFRKPSTPSPRRDSYAEDRLCSEVVHPSVHQRLPRTPGGFDETEQFYGLSTPHIIRMALYGIEIARCARIRDSRLLDNIYFFALLRTTSRHREDPRAAGGTKQARPPQSAPMSRSTPLSGERRWTRCPAGTESAGPCAPITSGGTAPAAQIPGSAPG